jgi:hypothetical protein
VRSCIAKIVFSPGNVRSATRAGGVSPPWERKRRCKSQPLFCNHLRACARSGWCEPAVVSRNALAAATSQLSHRGEGSVVCARTPLQPWFPTSGGLTPVAGRKRPQLQLRYSYPRRAHARRSCDSAVVVRQTSVGVHCKRGPLPNHGGLTPAALDSAVVGRRTTCCRPDDRTIRRKARRRSPYLPSALDLCPVFV